MNAKQRKELQGYADSLDEIKCAIEEMQEDETEKLDNMPESLQESERGEAMQEAIDNLESASSCLEEAIDYLNEILEGWPMDEITIKVTKDQAKQILEAIKFKMVKDGGAFGERVFPLFYEVEKQGKQQMKL